MSTMELEFAFAFISAALILSALLSVAGLIEYWIEKKAQKKTRSLKDGRATYQKRAG